MEKIKISFDSPSQTQAWASQVAGLLVAGDIILLEGDLGAGKTTLTKGLAAGLGIHANVKSPTFTLVREYHQGQLPLYHLDVYRLEDGGGEDIGLDEYASGDGVCVIEWAQYVMDLLPADYLVITITKDPADENKRTLELTAVGQRGLALLAAIKGLSLN